jgi:hypothetical protein
VSAAAFALRPLTRWNALGVRDHPIEADYIGNLLAIDTSFAWLEQS